MLVIRATGKCNNQKDDEEEKDNQIIDYNKLRIKTYVN